MNIIFTHNEKQDKIKNKLKEKEISAGITISKELADMAAKRCNYYKTEPK